LERYFFLDDSDLEKVQAKRRAHSRLGFAVQLTSARYLGRFMPDLTGYMDAAVTQLRADGFEVRDEDVARLSPFVRHHINRLGRYSFQLSDLPDGLRPLRDPGTPGEE
jgi:uncharacterized protein DUF4158/Tn3 transposase DDE domain-containing protein